MDRTVSITLGSKTRRRGRQELIISSYCAGEKDGGADAGHAAKRIVATCDRTKRGRLDRALLLIGFAGALRRSDLVALQVEDVALAANGLRIRILRGKTDRGGEGAEIGLSRGKHVETCPERAFNEWQEVAKRSAGPLLRRISTSGRILDTALQPDAVGRILAHRVAMAGIAADVLTE